MPDMPSRFLHSQIHRAGKRLRGEPACAPSTCGKIMSEIVGSGRLCYDVGPELRA